MVRKWRFLQTSWPLFLVAAVTPITDTDSESPCMNNHDFAKDKVVNVTCEGVNQSTCCLMGGDYRGLKYGVCDIEISNLMLLPDVTGHNVADVCTFVSPSGKLKESNTCGSVWKGVSESARAAGLLPKSVLSGMDCSLMNRWPGSTLTLAGSVQDFAYHLDCCGGQRPKCDEPLTPCKNDTDFQHMKSGKIECRGVSKSDCCSLGGVSEGTYADDWQDVPCSRCTILASAISNDQDTAAHCHDRGGIARKLVNCKTNWINTLHDARDLGLLTDCYDKETCSRHFPGKADSFAAVVRHNAVDMACCMGETTKCLGHWNPCQFETAFLASKITRTECNGLDKATCEIARGRFENKHVQDGCSQIYVCVFYPSQGEDTRETCKAAGGTPARDKNCAQMARDFYDFIGGNFSKSGCDNWVSNAGTTVAKAMQQFLVPNCCADMLGKCDENATEHANHTAEACMRQTTLTTTRSIITGRAYATTTTKITTGPPTTQKVKTVAEVNIASSLASWSASLLLTLLINTLGRP